MKLGSWLIDKKIRGLNITIDLTVQEYWNIASDILNKNELQRHKVITNNSAYALLKRDLIEGCIMPPIILAVTEQYSDSISKEVEYAINKGSIEKDLVEKLDEFIKQAFKDKELLILDGLQRTYTIKSALDETSSEEKEKFKNHIIRVEVYLGLSKMGILYRMLTLNTGQTPMSFRHQLEMLYHDYLDRDDLPDDIKVVREIDESRARGIGNYKYSDVIDLFYSYTTGNAQSVDKETLVSKLQEINFLEAYKSDNEDMIELLKLYNKFVNVISLKSNNWEFNEYNFENKQLSRPFGVNIASIFGKVQSMTGFGSACSILIRLGIYSNLKEISNVVEKLEFRNGEPDVSINQLIIILGEISRDAKKIGYAQREYFKLAFRELLNTESEAYCDLSRCWLTAQGTYNLLY